MADEDHTARGDIVRAILVSRDRPVLLDVNLAQLYGVTTGALNQLSNATSKDFPPTSRFG